MAISARPSSVGSSRKTTSWPRKTSLPRKSPIPRARPEPEGSSGRRGRRLAGPSLPPAMLPGIELRPGYRIPRLIRGTWQLHEATRTLDRKAALAELTATFDLGFSAIETADTYDGVEELLGAFRVHLRNARCAVDADALRVHTPVSQMGSEPLSVQAVRSSIDRSRRRLQQDRLDLVQLQWWNLPLPG